MSELDINSLPFAESLGKSSCGEVFALSGELSDKVAKQFAAMAIDRGLLAKTHQRLASSPKIEGVPEVFGSRFDSAPYLSVMERIEGEPLNDLASRKEGGVWAIVRDLVEILGQAHKQGVFHGHLHSGNILEKKTVVSKKETKSRYFVTDFGTGLVGEVYHIDLGDTAYYAAPEQLISDGNDWENGGVERWDVYSFGVIAYRLLNGRFPRGSSYLKTRDREISESGGRPVPVNVQGFLQQVLEDSEPAWSKTFGLSQEFKLYREIIEGCLHLDPAKRPVDLREVRNQFRSLQHRFALEDAEERVLKEKRKQKAKLFGARAVACCLGISFLGATYFLIEYLRKTSIFQNKVTELDQVVFTQKAHITHLDERWAETVTDLKKSREAADSFFQKMAQGDNAGGSGVASLRVDDLEKSRDYYLKVLADSGSDDSAPIQEARALHSLAHIERKMNISGLAIQHFRDAITAFEKLLADGPASEDEIDIHIRLADSHEGISSLLENPVGSEALKSLERAVGHFAEVIKLKPNDESVIMRQAGTSYRLGYAYDAHQRYKEAIRAYSQSADLAIVLKDTENDSPQLTDLVGKLQFQVAHSLRLDGRIEASINAHVASMETLESLRGVNGFSPLQSIQLASSFIELGALFATREANEEELDQLYNEALRLLTPLNTENPGDVEVAMLLCRSLVHLGELERTQEHWSSGYRLSVRGIEALKESLELTPGNAEGLILLSESRLQHLAFLEDEKESRVRVLLSGVDVAEEASALLQSDSEIKDPIRSNLKMKLGEIFTTYGELCKSIGETDASKRCLEFAAAHRSAVNESSGT
jgi:serine/threonine protein kinase